MKDRGLSNDDIRLLQLIVEERRDSGSRADYLSQEKERESRCPECNLRITKTLSFGEVGHMYDCPRREERYRGRTGNLSPAPANKKADRELAADGGKP